MHTHNCSHCGHEFNCHWQGRQVTKENCKTARAVKVNLDGPYCMLCYHLTMAGRVSDNRKWLDCSDYLAKALREAANQKPGKAAGITGT